MHYSQRVSFKEYSKQTSVQILLGRSQVLLTGKFDIGSTEDLTNLVCSVVSRMARISVSATVLKSHVTERSAS